MYRTGWRMLMSIYRRNLCRTTKKERFMIYQAMAELLFAWAMS